MEPTTAGAPAQQVTRPQFVGVAAGVTAAMALLTFAYRYLDYVANGVSRPWLAPLVEELTGHFGGALLLVPILLWSRRLGVASLRWPARAAWHAAAIALYSGVHTTFNWLSRGALFPVLGLGDYDYGRLAVRYAMELPKDASIYVLVFVVAALFERYRAARDAEVRARDLEARLARAQLENLQAQLNPHFVFNALNTISSVMYEDVGRADRMLAGLSDLLRRALHASHRQEVTLAEELEMLEIYADLMRARFGDRLHFEVDVEDGLADARVPTLLLQPLVENAMRHGAPPPPAPARIAVRVRREEEAVVFEVEDNGPGMHGLTGDVGSATSPANPTGVGLANTEGRLRALYGAGQAMTLGTGRLGGLLVKIRIPYQRRSPHTPDKEAAWTGSVS